MPDHLRAQGSKMENLPEAHGRSTEQIQPLENLRKEGYGEAFGHSPTALRPH